MIPAPDPRAAPTATPSEGRLAGPSSGDPAYAAALGRLAGTVAAATVERVEIQIPLLLDALTAAGIPAIVLKGPVTRSRLYGPDEPRPVADVDLLVPARSHRRARSVLASLGYARIVTGVHSDVLRGPRGEVDLHLALPYTSVPLARAFATLHERLDHLELVGREAAVLDVPAHVVHLALHAGQNGFDPDHRSFEEWRRGLEGLRDTDRACAATIARRLGVVPVWDAAVAALEPGADLGDLASSLPRRTPVPTVRGIVRFARSPLAARMRWRALRALVSSQLSDACLDAWRAERGLDPVAPGTLASTRAKAGRFVTLAAERTGLVSSGGRRTSSNGSR